MAAVRLTVATLLWQPQRVAVGSTTLAATTPHPIPAQVHRRRPASAIRDVTQHPAPRAHVRGAVFEILDTGLAPRAAPAHRVELVLRRAIEILISERAP